MFRTCFTTVSDLALCQRCPALLAYKIHMHEKSAWSVGINGGKYAYGSMFHKYIARVFFEAAARKYHPLHRKILNAVSRGRTELESLVRRDIFMPFLEQYSHVLESGSIFAMAQAVTVWIKAMHEFFADIPSLIRYPEKNMNTVFIEPEQKLHSHYDFYDGRLIITGCYDALMFNPDKAEARLFEFKGYSKSDITVPLSQSLIYSWLIEKFSGIVPSVEIIYLDEEKKPADIFDDRSVKSMIDSCLPELFYSAFNVISLKKKVNILRDKNLCARCKFNYRCSNDYAAMFEKKRRGSSIISVLIFFMAVMTITAQVFFFTALSQESLAEERELFSIQIKLADRIEQAKQAIKTDNNIALKTETIKDKELSYRGDEDFHSFYEEAKVFEDNSNEFKLSVHSLDYKFYNTGISEHFAQWQAQSGENSQKKIFPPLGKNYYLIRAYTKLSSGKSLMYQVIVKKREDSEPETVSYQEVWY